MISALCEIYVDTDASTKDLDNVLPANIEALPYLGKHLFNIPDVPSDTSLWTSTHTIVRSGEATEDYATLAAWVDMSSLCGYTILSSNNYYEYSGLLQANFPSLLNLGNEDTSAYNRIILKFANGYIKYRTTSGSNYDTAFFNAEKTYIQSVANWAFVSYLPCGHYTNDVLDKLYYVSIRSSIPSTTTIEIRASNTAAGVAVLNFLNDLESIPPDPPADTDPYADGGYSGGGGGDGSFNLNNDTIDFPTLPTLSAVDTGLVSIYTPSLTQLKSLATFLWNANPTDVDWWKKLVANPLDLILGLSIVPVSVPAGSAQTIKVGLIDTGVSVTKAASQFVSVDCGSVTINKNCGGCALDYSPFTKFSLYLPFIGTRTISCDDIMGRTVHVKYNVDLLSGGCTAMVKITGGPEDNQLDAILYQYSGACAISIPLTGETFTNMITSTIQLAASIGATVATGGAAAGVSAASAANSLMSMKPIIERAGGVSGAAGQLGIMQPYLIAEVPRQSVPANCNKFTGYPSNIKATIGDLTGYTEVEIIYIKGIEATQAELDELESVLKGGFII